MTGVTGASVTNGGDMRMVLGWATAVLAVAALGVGGCSGHGSSGPSGSTGGGKSAATSGSSGAPTGASFHGKVPPGFSTATSWTKELTWTKIGIGTASQSSQYERISDETVAEQQGEYGLARVVGGSVVVPSFASGGAAGPVVATLHFLDAKTGKAIAEKALPSGTFLGLGVDAVAGKPVAVVRYVPAQNEQAPVTTVFDASGTQVWSSDGQPTADSKPWATGLQRDDNKAPLFVAGYLLRLNNGSDTSDHTDSSYDVLDTSGKSVLHVPVYADKWDLNGVNVVGGYAVVEYDDSLAQSDTANAREHFAVYDLGAGGKKVGEVAQKDSGGMSQAGALAAVNGKVLLTWLGSGSGAVPPTEMTVLDTATGQTTPPVQLPVNVSEFRAVVDPATSNVVLYDGSESPSASTVVVSMSQGTVLWAQQDRHTSLIPLSLHKGTIYGVEGSTLSTPGTLLAVKETDGSPAGSDYELSPLDFTADGAPLFAEYDADTSKVTLGAGHTG
jgi:hypothetical protein